MSGADPKVRAGKDGSRGILQDVSQERVQQLVAMMPPDGVDLVQFLASGELALDGPFADDVKVRFEGQTGGALEGSGADAIQETWAEWLGVWETYRAHWEDVVDRGDRVVLLARLHGVSKIGGVELEQEAAAVFTFEDDKVVDVLFTLDREGALAD